MDLLIEFLFDLVFDLSVELASSKKSRKWIRYPLIFLISIFIIAILAFIGLFGVFMIANRKGQIDVMLGWLLIGLDVIMIISAVIKIVRQIKELKKKFALYAEEEKKKQEQSQCEETEAEDPRVEEGNEEKK